MWNQVKEYYLLGVVGVVSTFEAGLCGGISVVMWLIDIYKIWKYQVTAVGCLFNVTNSVGVIA